MKWFNNLSMRIKLILGFGLMWLLLAIVSIIGYHGIIKLAETEKGLGDVHFPIAIGLVEVRSNLNYNRAAILEMMSTTDTAKRKQLEQTIENNALDIDSILQSISRLDPDPQFQSRLKELKDVNTAYRQTRAQEVAFILEGKTEEARQLGLNIQEERYTRIRGICLELDDKAKIDVSRKILLDGKTANSTVIVFIITGVAALFLAILLIVLLIQSIVKPLSQITGAATRLASGELYISLTAVNRSDEVGLLAQAFSTMVQNIRSIITGITEGVALLSSTSSEILAATTQVASGTAENASAISETTTTVEEVRQAAELSSQKAKNVSDTAQRVEQVSRTGQKAVEETTDGMNNIREQMESIAKTIVRLSEQSQSVGGIIASVTDIADQSNLLAVNAAIEATRAGEQGKAFAVVAQEIKSLAEQSKQATIQVRIILNDVQKATSAAVMATEQGSKSVEVGVKQSAQAGEAIRVLAESSAEAVQISTQIVASSQQQVVGMKQIGTAMENINQAGAETAASMKQAETAARNLHELGQKLKGMMEQFKV